MVYRFTNQLKLTNRLWVGREKTNLVDIDFVKFATHSFQFIFLCEMKIKLQFKIKRL